MSVSMSLSHSLHTGALMGLSLVGGGLLAVELVARWQARAAVQAGCDFFEVTGAYELGEVCR